MTRIFCVLLATAAASSVISVQSDDKAATAILDKAINALGGADKLGSAKIVTWKAKGTLVLSGNNTKFSVKYTISGLDKLRQDFLGDDLGAALKETTVLDGNKGWQYFGDVTANLLDREIATEKRKLYLWLTPVTIIPLKSKEFKVQTAGEEMVNGKSAVGLKIIGPDGKDFKLFFDKESGLPVKQVATVAGFAGDEAEQVTIYSDYKDFAGIKKATKIETTRAGQKYASQEVTDFAVLKDVPAGTFGEPKG